MSFSPAPWGAMSARIFIVLGLIAVASRVQGAALLRGVVLANEVGGSPMANVEVSAIGGNPNNTGVDGQFTFKFPNKNPGDTIFLTVRKEEYVVVNDIQLELTLPANADERLVTLLLCKVGDREEMARRFYRLRSVEAIEEAYRKKLEEAQKTGAAEIAKVRQERDRAKETAEKAAEEFAKQKPGAGSELYRTAMQLFLEGKVDEALSTLEEEKLREFSEDAKERTDQAIQNWMLRAHLLTVEFRFGDAEKAYQGAIDTSPDSFAANYAFARFNQDLNRYDKARAAYARCLGLAKSKGNNGDIASILNSLATLDYNQYLPEAARKGYEEALKIRRELAQKNPDTCRPDLAKTLNNLAIFDRDQNRTEAARKELEESLQIRRDLARKNPEMYLPDAAMALNNLAILDRDEKRTEAARKEHEEALKIYRDLAQKNPETFLPAVAMALNNLAILDQDQKRTEAARKCYEEALKIRRVLAEKNLDAYLPDVAQTLNNLATLDRDQNRTETARQELEEALKIYQQFADRNPERFQSDVARVKDALQKLR